MKDILGSITLAQLKNFHKLAETEHFTDAARQLYITQPTLSNSIKTLENELGISLLYREGRRNVRLTKYGKEFDQQVGKILDDLETAVLQIRQHGSYGARSLNLGTIPTIQFDFLPNLLREVWDAYGYSSKIRTTTDFSNALIKGLKEQEYELVFCARIPEEHDIAFIPMVYLPLVAVVHEKGPYKDLEKLSLQDLNTIPFTTYHIETPVGKETRTLLNAHLNSSIQPVTMFDDEFMLSGAVSANENIVGIMLNTFEIEPFKEVKVIPIEEVPDNWHAICLAYDQRVTQSEFASDFIKVALDFSKRYTSVYTHPFSDKQLS